MALSLQEVLVIGSMTDQSKFSELTLDMFRMLQTMEREPQEDMAQLYDTSPSTTRMPFVGHHQCTQIKRETLDCLFSQENGGSNVTMKRENPHKYLLYKPTMSQFLIFLASGLRELPANGAMMIYVSGEGCKVEPNLGDLVDHDGYL